MIISNLFLCFHKNVFIINVIVYITGGQVDSGHSWRSLSGGSFLRQCCIRYSILK